jgi:hypothetical protein
MPRMVLSGDLSASGADRTAATGFVTAGEAAHAA